MAATAADLVDHVLPEAAPLRQWVLTLPFELRARLAFDGKLLGAVCRTFVDSVVDWYHRRMAALGVVGGRTGAVTAVQRTSSDLRLNPHLHTLALDGVFTESADGELEFHPLSALANGDVADVLQIACARILRLLRRNGVIEAEEVIADTELADSEPPLARSQRGRDLPRWALAPSAPRRQPPRTRRPGGLKRPFSDGTVAIDMDPLSLLVRLAMSVPPPRFNTVRYAGVLAAHSNWRARVIPPSPPPADEGRAWTGTTKDRPPTHRCGYRPWRELLKRTFKIDVERCVHCGARMQLRALIITTRAIDRILRWLGEPTQPPILAPARGPPFFKSHLIRWQLGQLEPVQPQLFDAH